ncbi:MAG: hypothetical protein ABI678_08955, partial [Kofleriaceae bacterium]
ATKKPRRVCPAGLFFVQSTRSLALQYGVNELRQLGLGGPSPDVFHPTPIDLPTVPLNGPAYYSRARSVATGMDFMCAVITGRNEYNEDRPFATGAVYCVGNNRFRSTAYPQFSAGSATPLVVTSWLRQVSEPGRDGATVFVASSSGSKDACAVIYTGDVWCWGANGYGQMGMNTVNAVPPNNTDGSVPGAVLPLAGVVCQENTGVPTYNTGTPCPRGVAVGGFHMMAITTSKALYVWGSNWWGQLGLGDVVDRWIPTIGF